MSVTATFSPDTGVLSIVTDSDLALVSCDDAGFIRIETLGGPVTIQGGVPTIANTTLIDAVGGAGEDGLVISELGARMPRVAIAGGGGEDVSVGGSGNDHVFGGADDDHLKGSGGADILFGEAGNDEIDGGNGDDLIAGGVGNDEIVGGAGNDIVTYRQGDGHDTIDGGDDFDVLDLTGSYSDDVVSVHALGDQVLIDNGTFIQVEMRNVELVRLHAFGGGDNIEVSDLSGTSVTQVLVDLALTAGGSAGNNWADRVRVSASDGDDIINPTVVGGTITVNGLPTTVTIAQAESNDTLVIDGDGGNDTIDVAALAAAGFQSLELAGWTGNDSLRGGGGNDLFSGGDGDDLVVGRGGNDRAVLEAGNDRFVWVAGDGNDEVDGGADLDTLHLVEGDVGEHFVVDTDGSILGAAVVVSRDIDGAMVTAQNTETFRIDALGGADTVTINSLYGTSATSVFVDLAGAPGATFGDGQLDRINLSGDPDGNAVTVGLADDAVRVLGLPASLTIAYADAQDELTITTFDDADVIDASALPSGRMRLTLVSGAGDDRVTGSAGDDTIVGGAGADVLRGGAGIDTASYGDSNASIRIYVPAMGGGLRGLGGHAQGDELTDIENIVGSAYGDDITADGADNFIDGGAGFDLINGGAGNDRLVAGAGEDRLNGGAGDDILFGGPLDGDVLIGGAGTDTAVFTGNRADYRIVISSDFTVTIYDPRVAPPRPADLAYEVENLAFADGTFAPVAQLDGIVWRHAEGTVAVGDRSLGRVTNSFAIAGTGDFDGDGDADILWRHDNGMIVVWEMQDGVRVRNHNLPSATGSFAIAGTGDFDGDGDADILWRGSSGQLVTWEIEDRNFVGAHTLPSASGSFAIAGTGDFDGDGDADILWRGPSAQVVTWEMEDGALVGTHALPQVSNSYSVAGTGDFDGDGDADILWRHTSGQVVTWEMENGALVTPHSLPQVSNSYSVAGTGDFDRDGDDDIVFRHDSGLVVTWDMEDGSFAGSRNFGYVGHDWQVRGTGTFDLA